MDAQIAAGLRRASLLYPHPIAVACGRVLRARDTAEQLDAILRAGEALTRYTAAVSLASLAARTDPVAPVPAALAAFDGNLSWGAFLSVIQQVAGLKGVAHPVADTLQQSFQANKQGNVPVNDALTALLNLRNSELGHDLASLSAAKAEVIFRTFQPDSLLAQALTGLGQLLGLPLFLFEQQNLVRTRVQARRLLLMGESDNPIPDEIELSAGADETGIPYLGVRNGIIKLWPWLVWDLAERRITYALFVIHAIGQHVKYRSMYSDHLERNSGWLKAIVDRRAGLAEPLEPVCLADGSSFPQDWSRQRQVLEQNLAQQGGPVPWPLLDRETLAWYAQRLMERGPGAGAAVAGGQPEQAIEAALLDGRSVLRPDEITQMVLLFGTDQAVRLALTRDMLDCRARRGSNERWDERVLMTRNIIQSLRTAVGFVGRHVGIDGATLDGLQAISGEADYIAMREALVNLFIHQDYADQRTVAQIEITVDRAMFFNAGKSLVSVEALVDGGKSQARNPLIGRALRLIGFAALAGSGLRALQQTWRDERRRPPRFESIPSTNTFALHLDWRKLPLVLDSHWHTRLGVRVTPQQARILSLLADPSGFTEAEIASGTGILLEDVRTDLDHLKLQALVVEQKNRCYLRDDLRQIVSQSPDSTESSQS